MLSAKAAILGINVLDHLIITSTDYLSFRQKELM
ncbi:MAG: JAB domain-containing protein [Candidatus Humimicrobiaceae bacterium]